MRNNLIFKLQLALKANNFPVTISNYQFYSDKDNRYITSKIIKYKSTVLFKSCSNVKLTKYLVNLLNAVRGAEDKETIDIRNKNIIKELTKKWLKERNPDIWQKKSLPV